MTQHIDKGIEIEARLPLSASQYRRLRKNLETCATFIGREVHSDSYWSPHHRPFFANGETTEALSIRQRNGKTFFSYKAFHPSTISQPSHCSQHETQVSDAEALRQILTSIDCEEIVTIDKVREVFIFEEKLELALDNVPGCGYFIEVEALSPYSTLLEARERIISFAKRFKLNLANNDDRGYVAIVLAAKRNNVQ